MAASVRQLLKRVTELEDELLVIKKPDRHVIELDELVRTEFWGGWESQQTGSDAIYGAGLMDAPVAMFYTNEANLSSTLTPHKPVYNGAFRNAASPEAVVSKKAVVSDEAVASDKALSVVSKKAVVRKKAEKTPAVVSNKAVVDDAEVDVKDEAENDAEFFSDKHRRDAEDDAGDNAERGGAVPRRPALAPSSGHFAILLALDPPRTWLQSWGKKLERMQQGRPIAAMRPRIQT